MDDEILITLEAAALLKVHPTTCRALAKNKKIPSQKIGRDYRYSKAAILAFLSAGFNEHAP